MEKTLETSESFSASVKKEYLIQEAILATTTTPGLFYFIYTCFPTFRANVFIPLFLTTIYVIATSTIAFIYQQFLLKKNILYH